MAEITITAGPSAWKEGWGKAPFHGMKAHFFTEMASDAIGRHGRHRHWVAACGAEAVTHDKAPMFEPGNWPRCKRCMAKKEVTHG